MHYYVIEEWEVHGEKDRCVTNDSCYLIIWTASNLSVGWNWCGLGSSLHRSWWGEVELVVSWRKMVFTFIFILSLKNIHWSWYFLGKHYDYCAFVTITYLRYTHFIAFINYLKRFMLYVHLPEPSFEEMSLIIFLS
jgi:hypothetical protein